MRYADKYENHFLNIQVAPAKFAEFAGFTRTALQTAGLDAQLTALLPGLEAAHQAFLADVTSRTASSGSSQSGTNREDATWAQIKTLVTELDITKVQPAYYNQPAELLAIYPKKRSGLTQAAKQVRLPRLTAYVAALEARATKLGAEAGQKVRALLVAYTTATTAKQTARKAVTDTIATLGPLAETLCARLWDVHTTALWIYRQEPARAATFFDYPSLPKSYSKPAAPAKPTPPAK